ncbi:hypothetical protein [Cellvibrio sp. QJXJ]|uniref:hypothetical protein n=1 Tax=Cellvibrio sp. QJXJ TaxID=2964606 RepID=UPI0021C2F447|nr:hypothetical protein [Cellvibrio sp. QJXJ]UUA75257.1 hypothetical protein NNX04_22645 [Cellvibrio sp. QJXJ]
MPPKKKLSYPEQYAQAVELLDGLGAGLEMSSWTPYVSDRLAALQAQAARVSEGVLASTGFAYFNFDDTILSDWDSARPAVAEFLQYWNNRDGYTKTPALAAVAAVDRATLQHAVVLNGMKADWEELHYSIRLVAGRSASEEFDSRIASENMRNLLRHIGEGRLNLDATDRKIPIVDGAPLTIRWFKANARPTARRTIADLVADMLRIREVTPHMDPQIRQELDADIIKYSAIDQTKEIAFRVRRENTKSPLVSHRFRSAYVDGKIRRRTAGYAANPILCLATDPVFTPSLNVYEETAATADGNKKNVQAMGPLERVSSKRLTTVPFGDLQFYFWYSDAPERKAKPPVTTKKNPYSATAFPGLWLGPRKVADGLNPTVIVQLAADRSQRRFSISKHGLESAWAQAAKVYSADRNIELDAVLAMRPSMQAVNDMLAWAEQFS